MKPRPALVIMAAGIGSRYGGHKQVEPVGPSGEIILDYSIYDALQAGFGKIVFVIQDGFEAMFRERFDQTLGDRCDTTYVQQRLEDLPDWFVPPPERTKPWGTAHAVLSCRDVIRGPFGVINADDFYGRGAFTALHDFLYPENENEYALVGYPIERTLTSQGSVSRGVCQIDEDAFLVSIVERKCITRRGDGIGFLDDAGNWRPISPETTVSMNMWGFPRAFLERLERRFLQFLRQGPIEDAEFAIPTAVDEVIQAGGARVRVLPAGTRWLGVTYREDLPTVREGISNLVRKGVYPTPLWSG